MKKDLKIYPVRVINGWARTDAYIPTRQKLFLEIGKIKPDVVVMDLGLYAKIVGIETSWRIRSQFDVPVIYV